MNTDWICGVIPPIVTPVDAQDRVDEPALRRVVDHVIAGGVHGILSLGSNGEFFGLEPDQQQRAVALTVGQVNGRVPVYMGIGAITTWDCLKLARVAEREKAQAITILPPMFLTPSDDELFEHFRAVAESTSLPVLLYNNPERMKASISADLVARAAAIPNIVGIKDSSGDMTLTAEFIRRTRSGGSGVSGGKDFKVMAGRDTLILATLAYGGAGCVAATANIVPALVVEIYEKFMAGDLAGARAAQYRLLPLRQAFSLGSFPAVTKDAMNLLGLNVGNLIRPTASCTPGNLAKLRKVLEDMGALVPDAKSRE